MPAGPTHQRFYQLQSQMRNIMRNSSVTTSVCPKYYGTGTEVLPGGARRCSCQHQGRVIELVLILMRAKT